MPTHLRLALEVACGVLAAASTSLVLFNLLSASSRRSSERTSETNGSQSVRGDDTDAQTRATSSSPAPSTQPLGLPPPPAYMPPSPIPPVYILTPPMPIPTYYPTPFIEPQRPVGPPPRPIQPVSTVKPSIVRLNDLQLLVHQQQNIFTEQWDDFSPRELPTENVAFIILSRSQRTPFVPKTLFLLEILSDALKRVLKKCDCLRYVESVFDPAPQVPLNLLQANIRFTPTNYSIR